MQEIKNGIDRTHLTHVQKDAAVAVGDDALLEDGRRQQVVQLLRYAHTLAEILAAGFM